MERHYRGKRKKKVGGEFQGQITERQATKCGFYLIGNGESLLVYETRSHVAILIGE